MTDNKVVPFGKHKGRPIDEVIATDPQYLQWLVTQGWFREKFPVLYQVVINVGGEPSETPEHNALQVRFLEDDFCFAFITAIGWRHRIEKHLESSRIERLGSLKGEIADLQTAIEKYKDMESSYYYRDCQTKLAKARADHAIYETPVGPIRYTYRRIFETRGIDIVLSVGAFAPAYHEATSRLGTSEHFTIELKPSLGDDYPAVLRQMKRNESTVLVFDQFTADGATLDQVVRTFATAGISIVPLAHITAASNPKT